MCHGDRTQSSALPPPSATSGQLPSGLAMAARALGCCPRVCSWSGYPPRRRWCCCLPQCVAAVPVAASPMLLIGEIPHLILCIVTGCHLLRFCCLWLATTVILLHFGQCIGHLGIMRRPSRPDDAHTALQPQIVQLLVQMQLHVHAAHVARHTTQVAIAQQYLVGTAAGV